MVTRAIDILRMKFAKSQYMEQDDIGSKINCEAFNKSIVEQLITESSEKVINLPVKVKLKCVQKTIVHGSRYQNSC